MTIETELAWAAGFFDGEGYVGLNRAIKNNKDYLRNDLTISQNDPEVLERFMKAVEIGRVSGPYKRAKENHGDFWVYRATSRKDIKQVFERIGPYLSNIKIRQFQATLVRSVRFCLICGSVIDEDKNARTKYCQDKCRNKAKNTKSNGS